MGAAPVDRARMVETSERSPEIPRSQVMALRILASATNRFEVPVALKFGVWSRETSLTYEALLPDRFRDEDVARAIEAMVWVYGRLREVGFPLFGVKVQW
ncbi:MAG: hypothetical protein QI223_01470 [Candidatus Korarchaeota archaeon]|nr:hypothetical protein [Candidatus Korarchaeota archaeon]